MPEQKSNRGNAVTVSPFESPFTNQLLRFGMRGLNLKDSLDALEGWSRHTNLDHDNTGEATVRAGQTSHATAGTVHHSVRKLRDEQAGTFTRVRGIDTDLYIGASGALGAAIDTGYSGDPLTLLPHRPTLSGDPWMFVADRSRMRKVRADGLDLPIGLPAPTVAAAVALDREYRRTVATFSATDNTQATQWTYVPGTDEDGNSTNAPSAISEVNIPDGSPNLFMTTDPGSAQSAYSSWMGIPLTRDLNTLSPTTGAPGDIAASDEDVMHVWLKTSHPQNVKEIRIYIVVSPVFTPTTLPGTPGKIAGNEDAYVKAFRQNDFVQFIQANQTQIDAAETARVFALRDRDLQDRAIVPRRFHPPSTRVRGLGGEAGAVDDRPSWAVPRASMDPGRGQSLQVGTGAHQWFERGDIGLSFRRGDFQRLGNTANRDWSTVTGLLVYISSEIHVSRSEERRV